MTQQEYEQAKRECWEEFKNAAFNGDISYITCNALDFAFDRAYALGKLRASCRQVKEAVTQEEIEKAAEEYVKEQNGLDYIGEVAAEYAFKAGANFTLGKQEKDADKISSLEEEIHIYAKVCSFTEEDYTAIRKAVEFGVSLAESDADTVISGWACRSKEGDIFLYKHEPKRIYDGEYSRWEEDVVCTQPLPCELFPDLTWESDPEPVEIIIKREKSIKK